MRIFRGRKEDVGRAMEFIGEHWKHNHILALSRELFEWQYSRKGKYYFYLAEDDKKKICGFYGIVCYNGTDHPDIAGSMWKVIKTDNPILGMEMTLYVKKDLNFRTNFAPGLNEKARKITELRGGTPKKLNHFYRLNDMEKYEIALIRTKKIIPAKKEDIQFERISTYSEFSKNISVKMLKEKIPYKDEDYYKQRFFEHPVYQYICFRLSASDGDENSFLFMRRVRHGGSSVLRIVDFIGNDTILGKIGSQLDKLMLQYQCEYVEFYCLGIDPEILLSGGFSLRDENDKNIIPHYFEPFERKNIDIYTGNIDDARYHMFIGDSDQDRPSIL